MQDVWYVLEDGRTVDPNDCAPDEGGALIHSSGVAVAMRSPGVPRSRGVDAEAERAKAAAADGAGGDTKGKAEGGAGKGKAGKDMKPGDQQQGYSTRESKAT